MAEAEDGLEQGGEAPCFAHLVEDIGDAGHERDAEDDTDGPPPALEQG